MCRFENGPRETGQRCRIIRFRLIARGSRSAAARESTVDEEERKVTHVLKRSSTDESTPRLVPMVPDEPAPSSTSFLSRHEVPQSQTFRARRYHLPLSVSTCPSRSPTETRAQPCRCELNCTWGINQVCPRDCLKRTPRLYPRSSRSRSQCSLRVVVVIIFQVEVGRVE